MSKETIDSLFGKMIIAQVFSMSASMLAPLIDGIITGRFFGVQGMAVASYASPVTMFMAALGLLFTIGTQIGCSQAAGRGDREEACRVYSTGVSVIVLISFTATLICLVFSDALATVLGAQSGTEVHGMLSSYLVGFSFGFIFMQLTTVLAPLCQLAGANRIPVLSGITLIVSDVLLDLVNVFLAGLGMFGMGAASAVAYMLSSLIAIIYVTGKRCMFTFRLRNISRRLMGTMLKLGIPAFVNQIGIAFMLLTLNHLLTSSGIQNAVSAFCAAQSIFILARSISVGMASATMTLTGIIASENDINGLSILQNAYIKKSIIVNAVLIIIVMVSATSIIGLFTTDIGVIRVGAHALRIFSFSLVFFSIDTCYRYYAQGLKRYWLSLIWSVLSSYVTGAIAAFAGAYLFPEGGIWFCFLLGEAIMMLFIVAAAFVSGNDKLSRDSFLLLPDNMKRCSIDCIKFCVHNTEEVISASSQLQEFCRIRGVGTDMCNAVSLCVEEAGLNAVSHGFHSEKNVLDISLALAESTITIQFRDNGIPFSPTDFYKEHVNDPPGENMGIHLIMGIARDVRYLQTLRLNCLFISFSRSGSSEDGEGTSRN